MADEYLIGNYGPRLDINHGVYFAHSSSQASCENNPEVDVLYAASRMRQYDSIFELMYYAEGMRVLRIPMMKHIDPSLSLWLELVFGSLVPRFWCVWKVSLKFVHRVV